MPEHRFAESLALSEQYAGASWWMDVYRSALPRHHSPEDDPCHLSALPDAVTAGCRVLNELVGIGAQAGADRC